MDIQVTIQHVRNIACDVLVVSATRKSKSTEGKGINLVGTGAAVDKLLGGLIIDRSSDGEFKGNLGELLTIHPMGRLAAKRVIVVGLGAQDKVDTQSIRRAGAIAARHAQQTGARQLALALAGETVPAEAQAQLEGALLGIYTFRMYQSTDKDQETRVAQIQLVTDASLQHEAEQAIHRAVVQADATNFARSLVNEPPNVLTPTELANRARTMAQEVGLECEVFDKEQIAALGMGGLIGVSQGSAEPPHFIILRYRGAPESKKGAAFVGKGITFDTGGISLKPAANMDEMKGDMGGAAAVIGAMQAIAGLKPAINVTALVPTCENKPGPTAYLPGDILRIMNGKTIEIVNTDAEGRLVLADALSYAVKEGLSPIVDLATLTGGVIVALGHVMTGLFCNNEQLSHTIIAAGQDAGEKYWPMPLDDEYNEAIKSDIADILQTGGRPASAVTAAKILENFVGSAAWAHLDIAGTSYIESQKPYQEKGATGVGVRTLSELALRLAQEQK